MNNLIKGSNDAWEEAAYTRALVVERKLEKLRAQVKGDQILLCNASKSIEKLQAKLDLAITWLLEFKDQLPKGLIKKLDTPPTETP